MKIKFYRLDNPFFAYVTTIDFLNGRGLLQIYSDWGTYAAFWGCTGDSFEKFLLGCHSSYVEQNLSRNLRYMGMKKEAEIKLGKFMSHCWPNIVQQIKKGE